MTKDPQFLITVDYWWSWCKTLYFSCFILLYLSFDSFVKYSPIQSSESILILTDTFRSESSVSHEQESVLNDCTLQCEIIWQHFSVFTTFVHLGHGECNVRLMCWWIFFSPQILTRLQSEQTESLATNNYTDVRRKLIYGDKEFQEEVILRAQTLTIRYVQARNNFKHIKLQQKSPSWLDLDWF